MPQIPQQTIEIGHTANVGEARRIARNMAETLGFNVKACEEITLTVSELASNLVKHAGCGNIILIPVEAAGQIGLQIESIDSGAGIANIESVMTDGYTTAGSLGNGLGSINRLMDEFDITSRVGYGTYIVCRKWLCAYKPSVSCPLAIGVATHPHPQYDVNGDSFIIKHWAESTLVGIIDGLGHGSLACDAAQAARWYVESHFNRPLEQIFRGADLACHATRGVVMALARFDWAIGQLSFASIGNIEARVFGGNDVQFIVRRGIVGSNAPRAVVTQHIWHPENVLVLHSDGLHTHWSWSQFPDLSTKSAEMLAWEFLQTLGKKDDDATVLVVKQKNA